MLADRDRCGDSREDQLSIVFHINSTNVFTASSALTG